MLSIQLPYDPANALLGISPKALKQNYLNVICTRTALFTIAKGENNPNVYQPMTRSTKCGTSMQWNAI